MPRTSDFISTVAAVFSHSHMAVPTPLPVSLSSASLPDLRPTSSQSSTSNISTTSTSSKRSKMSKKLSEKLKLHNDVWWTTTASQLTTVQPVVHEWNYMYF